MIKPQPRVIKAKPFSLSQCVHDTIIDNAINFVETQMNQRIGVVEFIEQPVHFRTFVESKDHMDFPPLSERQYSVFDYMIGDDPQKVFDNGNYLAVLAWGKGSLLGHQEVITADGLRYTLAECSERQLPVALWTKTDAGRVSTALSTPAIKKDHKENCFRVETSFGHVSEASEDHQYFTVNGWKKIKDLKVGDWICAAQFIPVTPVYCESVSVGKFVGYMLGDGCMSGNFSFYASFPDIINDFRQTVADLGGSTIVTDGTTFGAKAVHIRRPDRHNTNPVKVLACRLGLLGKTAADKRIPVEILFSPADTRRACIEGLFSTDGWISGVPGSPKTWEIGYISKSRKLVEDVDFALRSFGIMGKIRDKHIIYKGKERIYWQILIESAAAQIKFCNTFNVVGKRHKQAQLISDRHTGIIAGVTCPPELSDMLAAGIPSGQASSQGGRWHGYSKRRNKGMVFGYNTVCSAPWLKSVANPDIAWEKIKSIDPLGMQDVYTFTVPVTHNYLQGGLFHHNSGKDTLCVLILCYICYLLLCMKSPQLFLKLPEGECIDCVNVAPSGEKASDVFFEKLRQRLLRWRWLRDKYPIRNSGAFISQVKATAGEPYVTITKDGVIFPKLIRLLSKNSDNESAEGLNTLIYVLDEASAFMNKGTNRNAMKVYRNMRSSSTTRFGLRGKGFIISYPREINDFTMTMYKNNLKNLHVYTDCAATWEVKPLKYFSGKWFDFTDKVDGVETVYRIPIEFKSDFDADPTDAKMRLMAMPPETEHGFIEYPNRITECINPQALPIVIFEDIVRDGKVGKRVLGFRTEVMSPYDYIITIDLGAKVDSASLSMFHRELIGTTPVFVQDLVTGWIPDKKNKLEVSFINVREFIQALAARFNVMGVWFDQWQSILMREELNGASIPSFEYNLDYSDFKTFKEMLYTKRYQLLPFAPQITEIKQLIAIGQRIDHPRTGSKDYVDTIVGASKILLLKHKPTGETEEWGEVETIEENLHMMDPWSSGG